MAVGDLTHQTEPDSIASLAGRVEHLESQLLLRQRQVGYFEVVEGIEQVKRITSEIFGDFAIEESEDPEIPGERYITFSVSAKGDLDAILKMDDKWHSRVAELPINLAGLFCLSIDPQEE